MDLNKIKSAKQRYTVVGDCNGLNHAINVALQVAPTDLSVLIVGESGVGKEVIPRIIHDNSIRKNEKYFAINCGSIPEGTIDSELFGHEKGSFTGAVGESSGYFGAADKGTLFLDEVGELPLATQARLLRVLETGEYIRVGGTEVRKTNVRIVAATNLNLQKAISEGRFREDLYYRLNTIPIKMPALRERGNDIVLLFKHFALTIAERLRMERVKLSPEAEQILLRYKWPGNVRQLKNITEQISVISQERLITPEILRQFIPEDVETYELAPISNGSHTYENEREMLYRMLLEMRSAIGDMNHKMNGLEERLDNQQIFANAQQQVVPMQKISDDIYAEEITEPKTLEDMEKEMIKKALEHNNGNRQKTAEELGIPLRTLYRRITDYEL